MSGETSRARSIPPKFFPKSYGALAIYFNRLTIVTRDFCNGSPEFSSVWLGTNENIDCRRLRTNLYFFRRLCSGFAERATGAD
jgi:hypothetical protein